MTLGVVSGCASTVITERHRYLGEKLVRLERIVHDFAANPADVPAYAASAAKMAGAPQPTPKQIEIGDRLGAEVAKRPVADLQGMGLPAMTAAGQPAPAVDDVVL